MNVVDYVKSVTEPLVSTVEKEIDAIRGSLADHTNAPDPYAAVIADLQARMAAVEARFAGMDPAP